MINKIDILEFLNKYDTSNYEILDIESYDIYKNRWQVEAMVKIGQWSKDENGVTTVPYKVQTKQVRINRGELMDFIKRQNAIRWED